MLSFLNGPTLTSVYDYSNQDYVCYLSCTLYIPMKTLAELSSKLSFLHKEVVIERYWDKIPRGKPFFFFSPSVFPLHQAS